MSANTAKSRVNTHVTRPREIEDALLGYYVFWDLPDGVTEVSDLDAAAAQAGFGPQGYHMAVRGGREGIGAFTAAVRKLRTERTAKDGLVRKLTFPLSFKDETRRVVTCVAVQGVDEAATDVGRVGYLSYSDETGVVVTHDAEDHVTQEDIEKFASAAEAVMAGVDAVIGRYDSGQIQGLIVDTLLLQTPRPVKARANGGVWFIANTEARMKADADAPKASAPLLPGPGPHNPARVVLALRACIEAACPGAKIHVIPLRPDAATLRAGADHIRDELNARLQRLMLDLDSWASKDKYKGENGKKIRLEGFAELKSDADFYRTMFELQLEDLDAKVAAAEAALKSFAPQIPPSMRKPAAKEAAATEAPAASVVAEDEGLLAMFEDAPPETPETPAVPAVPAEADEFDALLAMLGD